ncbi:MAG: hypothetical protein IIT78_02520 [Mycoplasmataceae bacterium]|nr:hypothetical protein [Mycoplasmataceae bacterium]
MFFSAFNQTKNEEISKPINQDNYIDLLEKLEWALEMSYNDYGIGIHLKEEDANKCIILLNHLIKKINEYLSQKSYYDGNTNISTNCIKSSNEILDVSEDELNILKRLKWGLELCFEDSGYYYGSKFRLERNDIANSIDLLSYLIKYFKNIKDNQ